MVYITSVAFNMYLIILLKYLFLRDKFKPFYIISTKVKYCSNLRLQIVLTVIDLQYILWSTSLRMLLRKLFNY